MSLGTALARDVAKHVRAFRVASALQGAYANRSAAEAGATLASLAAQALELRPTTVEEARAALLRLAANASG